MKADLKTKWIEALRSGEYEQGQSFLREGDKFCCLGVLCDLKEPANWRRSGDSYDYVVGSDASMGLLPFSLKAETGINGQIESEIVGMNDEGKSFSEIADWIEANVPSE
jgi:hypothetical protein